MKGDTAFASLDIRRLAVGDLSRMREVDRTETVAAKYEVVRSEDGLSLSLVARACEPPEEFPHWDDEAIARRTEWWRRELTGGGAVSGAFAEGRLVGFTIVVPRPDRAAEMLGLFVDAEFRGRGIGSRLLAAAEEWVVGRGAERLYLHPNPTVATVEFYRKRGYVLTCLVDEAALSHPQVETCIVLAKPLPSGGRQGERSEEGHHLG